MKLCIYILLAVMLAACSDSTFSSGGSKSNKSAPQDNQNGNLDPNTQQPTGKNFGTGDDFTPPEDPNNLIGGSSTDSIVTFAMLVNDLRCGMCHTTVRGNIISVTDVQPVWSESNFKVEGDWFISGELRAALGSSGTIIDTRGALVENYAGSKLPKDSDNDGKPDFPKFDPEAIKNNMKGTVKSKDKTINQIETGNAILIGTSEDPIRINGEVLIEGDLVIKGKYKGIGNIYVKGRIYIPADLTATKSAFPFDDDPVKARQQASGRMDKSYDALGLASKNAIIISDFETYSNDNRSVFEDEETPPAFRAGPIGLREIYNWIPGGKPEYVKLLESGPKPCATGRDSVPYNFSQIDAYLYAENVIGGRASLNSFAINGGIMTDHFHIISAARHCSSAIHPIHGYPSNRNHINFDWRFVHGLQILKQLGTYFKN